VNRLTVKRLGFAVLGGLLVVSMLTAVVAEIDGSGWAQLYSLGVLEWIVPIVAGASVGAVAWMILGAMPGAAEPPLHTEEACPACGRLILDDWRLCPHCGTLVTHGCDAHQDVVSR